MQLARCLSDAIWRTTHLTEIQHQVPRQPPDPAKSFAINATQDFATKGKMYDEESEAEQCDKERGKLSKSPQPLQTITCWLSVSILVLISCLQF